MKRTCKGCYWYGRCIDNRPCGMYDPVDESARIITREQNLDRQNFTEDWLLYMNRDDDVDYCEEPVTLSETELVKTTGGVCNQ